MNIPHHILAVCRYIAKIKPYLQKRFCFPKNFYKLCVFTCLILCFLSPLPLIAQGSAALSNYNIPIFWDQNRKLQKPSDTIRSIRFLTEWNYPPFSFLDRFGQPTGFNIEIARFICDELEVQCTIQPRKWDALQEGLAQNAADAVIASVPIGSSQFGNALFSEPYYKTPARFIVLNDSTLPAPIAGQAIEANIGSIQNSAHENFLQSFFTGAQLLRFDTRSDLYSALQNGDIDYAFDDGVSASIWLNNQDGETCCRFSGALYKESRWFGEGAAIVINEARPDLKQAIDFALYQLFVSGRYKEIWLRYFPISPYSLNVE